MTAAVAQQPATFWAPEGRVAETAAKLDFVELEQRGKVERGGARQRLEIVLIALGTRIPGADFLAHVAAEQPVADKRPQLVRDGRAVRSSNS